MRLTLSLLLMGVLLAIPAVVLTDTAFERESQSETAARRLGTQFVWPEHPRAADPDAALSILAEAADSTGSNVLRTAVNAPQAGRKRITHYIYMGRDRTGLFNEFSLVKGRWLTATESRSGQATDSSAGAGTTGNVGVPAVFGGRYDLTFAPLRQAFDSLPSAGLYVVESVDNSVTDRFLAIVHQRLVDRGVAGLAIEDLTPVHLQGSAGGGSNLLKILAYILAITATLIIAFILLREGKRIGVLRLLGHSSTRIWYKAVGQLQVASLLIGLCACVVVFLVVPGVDPMFLRSLAVTFTEVSVVGFATTMGVSLVIINRVEVGDLIKGGLQ